jgi:hypothetical protein
VIISPLVAIVGADSRGVSESSTTVVVDSSLLLNPSCKGSAGAVSLCAGAAAFVEWFVIRGVEWLALGVDFGGANG